VWFYGVKDRCWEDCSCGGLGFGRIGVGRSKFSKANMFAACFYKNLNNKFYTAGCLTIFYISFSWVKQLYMKRNTLLPVIIIIKIQNFQHSLGTRLLN
jgi:hypothetical protein